MEYTKISFNLDSRLADEITRITNESPGSDRTQTLNNLIERGLTLGAENRRLKHLVELVCIKILHNIRTGMAKTNDAEFMEQMDKDFGESYKHLTEAILDNGVNYDGDN